MVPKAASPGFHLCLLQMALWSGPWACTWGGKSHDHICEYRCMHICIYVCIYMGVQRFTCEVPTDLFLRGQYPHQCQVSRPPRGGAVERGWKGLKRSRLEHSLQWALWVVTQSTKAPLFLLYSQEPVCSEVLLSLSLPTQLPSLGLSLRMQPWFRY